MPEFHQHPDGHIYVRGQKSTYGDTPANFSLDFGMELPALAEGADEQLYSQDRRHCYMAGGDIVAGGPMPWPLGDSIIDQINAALAAQLSRIPPVAEPQPRPPIFVTPAQAKVALYNAGMLDAVEAAIATSYRPIQIYWNSASVFDRNHPYIVGVGALLGLSDDQMDALFLAASSL